MRDLTAEIRFKTSRSGGKGGQNVNKVESKVEGIWKVADSRLFSEEEKFLILKKLSTRINQKGELTVDCQESRSQLQNKAAVIRKINEAVEKSLKKTKKRIATKPTGASKEKRLESKKQLSIIKEGRKKIKG